VTSDTRLTDAKVETTSAEFLEVDGAKGTDMSEERSV